jgi:hypothetical protein
MRLFRWVVGLMGIGLVSLAVVVPASVASVHHIDLQATLHGGLAFPDVSGSSTYDRGGGQREVTVTVTGLNGTPSLVGKRVVFFVAGKKIGTRLVGNSGTVTIERQTIHGQFVPYASAGNWVRVRTLGGELVALGKYHRVAN